MFWESLSVISLCVLVYIAINIENQKNRTNVKITIHEVETYEK